jgi:hypothetical protein
MQLAHLIRTTTRASVDFHGLMEMDDDGDINRMDKSGVGA